MRLLKNRSMAFYVGFVLILTMAIGGVAIGAFADGTPTTATATVTAGTLSLTDSNSAVTVSGLATLNGTDQTGTYTLPLRVSDFTGSGNGWNLSVTSTQFTTGGQSAHTLSDTASTLTAGSATTYCPSGTCTVNAPSNNAPASVTIPADTTAPTAVEFFNAAVGTGMGAFSLTPSVAVSVPASTYAGTYQSTVTVILANGPN